MGLFNRKNRGRGDDEPVDPEERSTRTGLKYKDLQLLGAIKDAGCDLTAPRHVLHYSYFSTQPAAKAAAETCRGQGWDAFVREPLQDFPDQWGVIAEQAAAVLTLQFVRESTDFFEHLAALHNGEHDGWEAGPDLVA